MYSVVPKSYRKNKKESTNHASRCLRFCHRLDKMHVSFTEFRLINWFPPRERFQQSINAITFKFINNRSHFYLNEMLKCMVDKRNSFTGLSLFTRLTQDKKPYRTLGPLCGIIYLNLVKNG